MKVKHRSLAVRFRQQGLSLLALLGGLLSLLLIAAIIYLFLPAEPSPQTIEPDNSPVPSATVEPQPEVITDPQQLSQLSPVDDADPEVQQMTENNRQQPLLATAPKPLPNDEKGSQTVDESTADVNEPSTSNESAPLNGADRNSAKALQHLTNKESKTEPSSSGDPFAGMVFSATNPLDNSDALVRNELSQFDGASEMLAWLIDAELIRHFVVLVDNVAVGSMPSKEMVFRAPKGSLMVTEHNEDEFLLDAANYRRYQPYIELLSALPPEAVIASYQRFYPLLQRAYGELGYPRQSFHYRLQEAVDKVLNTPMPDPGQQVVLVQPSVMYEYADERIEASSDVEKMLLRMGPENSVLFKELLWQWKRYLVQLDHG